MSGKGNAGIFAVTAAMLSLTVCAARVTQGAPLPHQAANAEAVRATPTESATESVPRLVQFTGTLRDAASHPVAGVASVTFAIYAEQDGGAALWSETQNVIADSNGHYNALLGGATAAGMPAELFGTGQSRWLGVTIARQPEMPRVLLASVPYALKAADADTLGGLPASAYMTTQNFAALNARTPASATNSTTIVTTAAAETAAPESSAAPAAVIQATPTGGGTANFIPLWTSTSNLGNSKLFQSTGGNIGVNTTSPVVLLDVNGDSIFRGSFQLVPQGTASATTGQPSHSYQWEASTYNSSTKKAVTTAYGFRATPQGNNTTNPTSSLDLYYGPGGGTLTDTGLSINNKGIVTFVAGQPFPGSSATLNEVNLPNSTSATSGVLTIGGNVFLNDFGDPSNTFVGEHAGGLMKSSGANGANTAVGEYALNANTTGIQNTAMGGESLLFNTTGENNSGLGVGAIFNNTTGNHNTGVGIDALIANTTGTGNVGLGSQTGLGNATGNYNVFLGYQASASTDALLNAIAIGAFSTVNESNAMVLGGSGTGAVKVGIGTSAPAYALEVHSIAGAGAGIAGISNVAGDNAVFGNNTAGFSSSNGGYFTTNSEGGSGVVGVNTAGGLAGYFGGNVEVAGTLIVTGSVAKGGGSFKIDDPIAPAQKYLSHSFVESPDMMDIYNGNVTTDAKGYATITMPAWFEALNGDFRYQLTTVGAFSQAMIAQEITGGKFRIRTSKPHVKVSWQVTGVRHDAWANANRIPTEEDKPANEQGHYLHPELFGAGPDKSMAHFDAPATAPTQARATHEPTQEQGTGKR
jgi:trimeric autotransporter adhesin